MSPALAGIERRIFQARGALYEGDVFSVLKRSPYAIRAFEFGLADGAIDCEGCYSPDTSYADRFWDVHDRRNTSEPRNLIPFEVKSTVAGEAGDQVYLASSLQQKYVAFFIGITATDPSFVDVLPNYGQDNNALQGNEDPFADHKNRESFNAINTTRQCKLPASAYRGLDQCGSPYRMPIRLLGEAIARIRRCAVEGITYVNPGNGLAFPRWRPKTTQRTDFLAPGVNTAQHSAYELILDILRFANSDSRSSLKLDFVGVQPRLADFRLTIDDRTVWLQHKLDSRVRTAADNLSNVPIARAAPGNDVHYFFSAFDKFDFLWYQFSFRRGGLIEDIFFFVPEGAIPDAMFTTLELNADLRSIENLEDYRISMDDEAQWLAGVERIIRAHPFPRKAGDRPIRKSQLNKVLAGAAPAVQTVLVAEGSSVQRKGRHEFAQATTVGLRNFYNSVMEQCARSRSGMILVMATNHLVGELGYCRYRWTEDESNMLLKYRYPPRAAHHLPADTAVVPICYYTQHAESSFQGPNVRPPQFRRLNSCTEKRLVVWDIEGPDTSGISLAPVVIPSDDISPTESQREVFEKNTGLNKNSGRQRETPGPNLSAVLSSGLYCADYAVEFQGPNIYEGSSWARLWQLLDKFTLCDTFEHPRGHGRQPGQYCHTLRHLDQCLRDQQELDNSSAYEEEY